MKGALAPVGSTFLAEAYEVGIRVLYGEALLLNPGAPLSLQHMHVPTWRDSACVLISFRFQRTFVAQFRWGRDRTARAKDDKVAFE